MYNPNLHFHFTGIGGSGMSGIAEILLNLGFKVSGSDLKIGPACEHLVSLGAVVSEGHAADNLAPTTSLLVFSSAVSNDNPEVLEARRRGLPVVRRAEVLAELMRLKYGVAVAGSHGKTTTTSLCAFILESAGFDPTVVIGGQVRSMASGGKLGRGDFLVAESDESDRSFLLLKPTIAIITNIDSEHLGAEGSLGELEDSFRQFIESVPFYGLAIMCSDDQRVLKLAQSISGRKLLYGLNSEAELQARAIHRLSSGVSFGIWKAGENLGEVTLPMFGMHNVSNALAAIAVALELSVPFDVICSSLSKFPGIKRRLEVAGVVNGVTLINDYGHHPTEIKATLEAVRAGWSSCKRVIVVFQPHRFTRTRDCFDQFLGAFEECDELIVSDIYSAGEMPLVDIDGNRLCAAILHGCKRFLPNYEVISEHLKSRLEPGDVVLFLGAGSIGAWPELFLQELQSGESYARSA